MTYMWNGTIFSRLRCDANGAVSIIMALALIPLVVIAGIGVDTGRGYYTRGRLQSALDSAALAGGRAYQEAFSATTDQRKAAATTAMNKYFAANMPTGFLGTTATVKPVIVSDDGTNMDVSVSITVPTLFVGLLSSTFNTMTITATAEVQRAYPKMELVFVVDNTGSQYDLPTTGASAYNRPMERLRRGMRGIVNDLFDRAPKEGIVRVGIIPFWHSINIKNEIAENDNNAAITGTNYGIPAPTIPDKFAYLMDRCVGNNAYCTVGTWPTVPAAQMKAYTSQAALDADFSPTKWRGCVESSPSDPYVNAAGSVVGTWSDAPPSPMRWWPYLFSSTFATNTTANNSGTPKAPATACRINQCPTDSNGCSSSDFLTTAMGNPGTRNDWVPKNTTCYRYSPTNQTTKTASETAVPCISDAYETIYNASSAKKYCEVNTAPRATTTTLSDPAYSDANNGPNMGCAAEPILPLTGNRGQVLRKIDNLKPSNWIGTHGDAGMAWAPRVLSPRSEWKGFWGMGSRDWPSAWNSSDTKKVVVMVLDDGNDRYAYSYYGYPQDNRLGSTAIGGSTRTRQNALQLAACTYLKSQGVAVYTIVMTTTDTAVISMMQQCATTPSMAQAVENNELEDALANVQFSLMNLHLSK